MSHDYQNNHYFTISVTEHCLGEKRKLNSWKCTVYGCHTQPPVSCPRQSTLQTPSAVSSVRAWPWPRSRQRTWEINWAGLLTQQVPWLPSTHPSPICQLASCSAEPWQQGTATPARLHYACQMGWELDSNSHHGGRERREIEPAREMEEEENEGGRKCGGGEKKWFLFSFMLQVITF